MTETITMPVWKHVLGVSVGAMLAFAGCSSVPDIPPGAVEKSTQSQAKFGSWRSTWTIYTFELTFIPGESDESGPARFVIRGLGVPRSAREGLEGSWTRLEDGVVETRFYRPDTKQDEVKRWAIEGVEADRLWLREVTEGSEEDSPTEWFRIDE